MGVRDPVVFSALGEDKSAQWSLAFPCKIEEQASEAVFDTFASTSVISAERLWELGLSDKREAPAAGERHIVLGDGSTRVRVVGTARLQVEVENKPPIKVRFKVVATAVAPVIVGLPDGQRLGFGVVGLPFRLPSKQSERKEDLAGLGEEDGQLVDGEPSEEEKQLLQSLLGRVLKENQALPVDTKLKHDHAVVSLDTGDAPPVHVRPYPIPQSVQGKVLERIREWEEAGFIEPSTSKWNHPLVAAKKMSGGVVDPNDIRLCVSTKSLNAALPEPEYNLPPIAELFGRLHGARRITSLDGKNAYHLLTLDKESRDKTAFTAPDMRRWQWKRAFFGISIIASHFQWLMESILAEWRDNVLVYIDDIIIFSKEESVEAHAALEKWLRSSSRSDSNYHLRSASLGSRSSRFLGSSWRERRGQWIRGK